MCLLKFHTCQKYSLAQFLQTFNWACVKKFLFVLQYNTLCTSQSSVFLKILKRDSGDP